MLAPRTGLSLARVSNHVFCPSNDRVVFVIAGSNPVASTNTKNPTLIGWVFLPGTPVLARFQGLASRAPPLRKRRFAPTDTSLFSVFSGGHASVLEAISFAGTDLEAVGCGWQLLYRWRLNASGHKKTAHDLTLRLPIHRQRVALEPDQVHTARLPPGHQHFEDVRREQGQAHQLAGHLGVQSFGSGNV